MVYSSDVATDQAATAAQYNALRDDIEFTWAPVPSDSLRSSNDASKGTTSATYVKVKETKINEPFTSTIRIRFSMNGGNGGLLAYGKIYKNGVAIGTERSQGGGDNTYSEDIALTLVANDLLQIYAKTAYATVTISNFQLYYSMKPLTFGSWIIESEVLFDRTAISTTNQDP